MNSIRWTDCTFVQSCQTATLSFCLTINRQYLSSNKKLIIMLCVKLNIFYYIVVQTNFAENIDSYLHAIAVSLKDVLAMHEHPERHLKLDRNHIRMCGFGTPRNHSGIQPCLQCT